ncbi:MAG: hypothetical protein KAX40_10315 [Herpetosiphon sp.]|nr:hypothetical protein [Herpetosiphon sp.]
MQTPPHLLTIELVPATCWYKNLRSMLKRDEWDRLRRMVYERAHHRCEICGGHGERWAVECHEIWQYDDTHHVQRLAGLIALCPACHEVKHMGLANSKGRGTIAARHLAKVNGWTLAVTNTYIKQQFDVWQNRSQHTWRVDLAWLDQWRESHMTK